jgi:hypothetical protein
MDRCGRCNVIIRTGLFCERCLLFFAHLAAIRLPAARRARSGLMAARGGKKDRAVLSEKTT